MSPKSKGVAVGGAWFVLAGGAASMSLLLMVFMHSGGVTSPGPVFGAVLLACAIGAPPVIALAGVPLAYRIYHQRPALKVALLTFALTFAVFVTSWVVPIVVRGA
ncbi:MAG: hypothetical protein R3E66_06640 [bacterium]